MTNPEQDSTRAPGMVRNLVNKTAVQSGPEIHTAKPDPVGARIIYKAGDVLPTEVTDLNEDDRPLIWRDLHPFANRHKRTTSDIVYDLTLLTSHVVSLKSPTAMVVPFDLELLMRILERHPSSCSWNRPGVRTMFEILYGPLISKFSPDLEDAVRLALGRRYAKLLGRVDTTQYRWLAADGEVTRRMSNILSKIEEVHKSGQDARLFFEHIAKRIWLLRGYDVELMLPLPTVANMTKKPGARGRSMSPKKKLSVEPPVYAGGAFS